MSDHHNTVSSKYIVASTVTATLELKDVELRQTYDTEAVDVKKEKVTSHEEIVVNLKQPKAAKQVPSNNKSLSSMLFGRFLCCFGGGGCSSVKKQPAPKKKMTQVFTAENVTFKKKTTTVENTTNPATTPNSAPHPTPISSTPPAALQPSTKQQDVTTTTTTQVAKPQDLITQVNTTEVQMVNKQTAWVDQRQKRPIKKYVTSDVSIHAHKTSVTAHARHFQNGRTLLPPISAEKAKKKTLVLDLDETLVHSSFKVVPNADFVVPVEIERTIHNVYVCKRPGVDAFLAEMGKLYEIVVFTASLSKYADPVLDLLDVSKVVSGRLFREHCTFLQSSYVKDLSKLGRDISQCIIVDNSPACFALQPENAVHIKTWLDDPSDRELDNLTPWLQRIASDTEVFDSLAEYRSMNVFG